MVPSMKSNSISQSNRSVRTVQRKSRVCKIVKSAILILVILTVVVTAIGAGYQVVGTWQDARRFPQQGRSIPLGPEIRTTSLNLDCSGLGRPTVVLDSGIGVPALGWIKVQPEVAKFTRVCSYDRAGYGWSDTGQEPRTSVQISRELKALLAGAGEVGPYILVGHSFGGFNVRVFTKLYPADVSGLVLVDGANEDEEKRINEILPATVVEQEQKIDLRNAKLNQFLTPLRIYLGIQRLQVASGWGTPNYGVLLAAQDFPKIFRQELLYLRQQEKFQDAVTSESKAFGESIAQVRAAGNLGDRPLIVLTAGLPYPPDPLLTKMEMNKESNLWINVLQAQEAHLSSRGKQIIVPDSGHMIPFKRPDTVIDAIRDVFGQVSGK
jgi:pimeloyl-ACP methyl ester carboxylesterase